MTPESKTKVPRPITTVERQIFAAYQAAEARADRAEQEVERLKAGVVTERHVAMEEGDQYEVKIDALTSRADRAEADEAILRMFRDQWYENDLPAMQRLALWLAPDSADEALPRLERLVQMAIDRAEKAESVVVRAEAERDEERERADQAEADAQGLSAFFELAVDRYEAVEAEDMRRERDRWKAAVPETDDEVKLLRAGLERLKKRHASSDWKGMFGSVAQREMYDDINALLAVPSSEQEARALLGDSLTPEKEPGAEHTGLTWRDAEGVCAGMTDEPAEDIIRRIRGGSTDD